MKRILSCSLVCVIAHIFSLPVVAAEGVKSPEQTYYGPWPLDQFFASSANFYQLIANKKLDNKIIVLNDLSDTVASSMRQTIPVKEKAKLGVLDKRWGSKPRAINFLYHVVEHDDSEFKRSFLRIFGKKSNTIKPFMCHIHLTKMKI